MKKLFLILLLSVFALPAKAETEIAFSGPLSGPVASWGEKAKTGAELAVEDINAKGGVLGQKLKMSLHDDACEAKQAVTVANRLLAQKIAVVIGPLCSTAAVAAADVYSEEGVLAITPVASSTALTDKGRWNIFRAYGRDDVQGRAIGKFVTDHFPTKNIAIVHDKQTYSLGLANEVQKYFRAQKMKEKLYDTITPGEKDYSALVSKLKQENIDVLVFTGFPAEAGLIMRQLKEQNANIQAIGGDAFYSDEIKSIAGDAVNGAIFTFLKDPSHDPQNADLVKRLKKKKIGPDVVAFYGYNAVQLWADAANKAGSIEARKVADVLHTQAFETVIGKVAFDQKGDLKLSPFVIYQWNNGKFDLYKPASEKGTK